MRTITFISGKGGSGKTIITSNLGAYLSRIGYKVLLVDWDFFARGLSYYILEGMENLNYKSGLLEAFENNTIGEIKPHPVRENLDILSPSSSTRRVITFNDVNKNLNQEQLINNWTDFTNMLSEKYQYDYVIVDSHSGSEFISLVPTFFSDEYVIVCEEDRTSWRVSLLLKDTISDYAELQKLTPPKFGGFILNQTIGKPSDDIVKFIEKQVLGGKCLATIPLNYKVRKAFALDKLIVDTYTNNSFVEQIRYFSKHHLGANIPALPQPIVFRKKLLQISKNPMIIASFMAFYLTILLFFIEDKSMFTSLLTYDIPVSISTVTLIITIAITSKLVLNSMK